MAIDITENPEAMEAVRTLVRLGVTSESIGMLMALKFNEMGIEPSCVKTLCPGEDLRDNSEDEPENDPYGLGCT